MSKSTTYESFRSQLALLLQVSEDDLENSTLEDIKNYDSLGRIEVSALVEDCFGYAVSQTELDTCKTASDLFDLVSTNG
jgi:acyl carrier protein